MNDKIKIQVKDKSQKTINLFLSLKVYYIENNMQYIWRTPMDSNYFLEIIVDDKNYIFPQSIKKDLRISTTKEEIATKVMEKIPVYD